VAGDAAEVLAGDVGRQAGDALHVVAVVLAGHRARADRGHVAQQEARAPGALDGDGLDLADRIHDGVGDLDLHLVADAGLGVGPVAGHDEAARRGGRNQGPGDLRDADAAEAGPLAVDLDGESGDDGAAGEHDTVATDIEGIAGGSGADKLTGNAAANAIRGGAGDDLIDGLGGADELLGESGDDTLVSLDGVADVDDCGDGTDTTVADTFDARTGCELPVPPPAPDAGTTGGATGTTAGTTEGTSAVPTESSATPATGPLVRIGPAQLRLDRRGRAPLRVGCPESAAQLCAGTLSLRGKARSYGSRGFSIATGRTAIVRVRPARRLRRALAREPVRVRAVANVRDAASIPRESRRTVTLIARSRGR
jgi:hypothetical protein